VLGCVRYCLALNNSYNRRVYAVLNRFRFITYPLASLVATAASFFCSDWILRRNHGKGMLDFYFGVAVKNVIETTTTTTTTIVADGSGKDRVISTSTAVATSTSTSSTVQAEMRTGTGEGEIEGDGGSCIGSGSLDGAKRSTGVSKITLTRELTATPVSNTALALADNACNGSGTISEAEGAAAGGGASVTSVTSTSTSINTNVQSIEQQYNVTGDSRGSKAGTWAGMGGAVLQAETGAGTGTGTGAGSRTGAVQKRQFNTPANSANCGKWFYGLDVTNPEVQVRSETWTCMDLFAYHDSCVLLNNYYYHLLPPTTTYYHLLL